MIQEATLRSFFEKSGGLARGTGFLARFLVAWPESTQGFRPFTEAPTAWPALSAFHRRIAAILSNPVRTIGAPAAVVLPTSKALQYNLEALAFGTHTFSVKAQNETSTSGAAAATLDIGVETPEIIVVPGAP